MYYWCFESRARAPAGVGAEPAQLSCYSRNGFELWRILPPIELKRKQSPVRATVFNFVPNWCGLGDSNSWPLPWQGSALTTELNPHNVCYAS